MSCYPVAESDLIGSWSMTEESRHHLSSEEKEGWARIVLNGDGTFEAYDMMMGYPTRELVSGAGRWELLGQPDTASRLFTLAWKGNQVIRLDLLEVTEGSASVAPYSLPLSAYATKEGPQIFYFNGDPDNAPVIYFKKERRSTHRD